MLTLRPVQEKDRAFWYDLDAHLSSNEFCKKVRDGMGYVIELDIKPIGVLRYNLFWDSIPFLTLLFLQSSYRNQGLGAAAMAHWEAEMKRAGYDLALVSTQVDEQAQHFYRKLGYKDCGGLLLDVPGHEQPMELFLRKAL